MTDEEIDEALKSGLFELGDPSRAELTCYLPEGKELPAVVKEKALKGGNAISYDGCIMYGTKILMGGVLLQACLLLFFTRKAK